MNKNPFKKIILSLLLIVPILALITYFCNPLHKSLLKTGVALCDCQVEQAQNLGDRGSVHLPDIGISLPEQTWFIVLVGCLAVITLTTMVILIVLKVKTNRKHMAEQNRIIEAQKEEKVKGASLKEIVAKNMENDKKEYEKIDNPKH